jgi:hypothetical protein
MVGPAQVSPEVSITALPPVFYKPTTFPFLIRISIITSVDMKKGALHLSGRIAVLLRGQAFPTPNVCSACYHETFSRKRTMYGIEIKLIDGN